MYIYENEKPALFTLDGIRMLFAFRDSVTRIAQRSTAIMMEDLMQEARTCGSSWTQMACVDLLVELGELCEISAPGCAGQHRTFVKR